MILSSEFKRGDLLEHRASGERCIFVGYQDDEMHWCHVSKGLNETTITCSSASLTKVKKELQPEQQIPVCTHCGSADVRSDAYAAWSVTSQDWEITSVFDSKDCEQCGEERNIKFIPLEEYNAQRKPTSDT